MAKYYYGLGRRKTSTATVKVFEGAGENKVNEKTLEQVYPVEVDRVKLLMPFSTAGLKATEFNFVAKVNGGGTSSQLEAIRHGITRALMEMNPEFRKPLKTAGFVTRDPRMVERKKAGHLKARKSEQYSKR